MTRANSTRVVPDKRAIASADPGPITTDVRCCARWGPSSAHDEDRWLWVPAFAGTTKGCLRLHRRPLADAREPGGDIGVGGIERLADLAAEIDPAIEQDVGEREAIAAEIVLAGHLPVQPLQPVGRDLLQP